MPLLIGPLAHPLLRARLAPQAIEAEPLQGRLIGGRMAGIAADGWPRLAVGSDSLPLWQADWTPALRRYAAIFGLAPQRHEGREVLGLGEPAEAASEWQPELAAAMADRVLALPWDQPAEAIRRRLPMIASWVASRQRALAETAGLPHVGPAAIDRTRIDSVEEPYADYFSVEAIRLSQHRNDGGRTPPLLRAVFVSGDATVVLPWDPLRDRVMLIDQLRAGPLARGDAQPWLYETVAGRVDAGETPEQAARREAVEETGIAVTRLFPAPHNYPSPGAVAEYLYLYVGIADLPDDSAGLGGLATEDEDIRSHLIPRAELTRMALAGEIRNGPLLNLALWLELRRHEIRRELGLEAETAPAGLPPS
ncbi:NUDIX domain-containing protein [Paracoccus sp. PS-1]|uniref:NUDIX domain-containing protein n=1 Tax=unclassified Paracoccus (in: a-proteobacteria) TaxID=2688777 RepID=UPI00048FDF09|nr:MULTISPECIES: NUDIX domain-containing protein [unclassified Paracoccus (in: a-proteobacteria)]MDQ7261446.1 NUDIX domain-containing protein [Paracoccus sp. PS1]